MNSHPTAPSWSSPPASELDRTRIPRVIAVCVSAGGVPKRPLLEAEVCTDGIHGDLHAHAKHNRPDRALSLFDLEILRQLVDEGFPLEPGTAGENITVEGLSVQELPVGTVLLIGEVLIRLEAPRKPCYVLDVIHPQLKEAIIGRCGYMASVLRPGVICPGMTVHKVDSNFPLMAERNPISSLNR